MGIVRADIIHDAGKVAADGSRLAGCQNGAPAKSATGIYTYTMRAGAGIDAAESACLVTPNTADRSAVAVHTSDTVLTVTLNDLAGTDADSIWSFAILNLAW